MPKDTGPFKHGEKVLVPHTDKLYEAKVSGVPRLRVATYTANFLFVRQSY